MLLVNILLFILCCYLYVKYKYKFWSRRKIPFIKPKFPFGNIKGLGKTIHSSHLITKFYKKLKTKGDFGGIFFFLEPVVLVLNLDFLKMVFIKDFNYFTDRGLFYNEKEPLSLNLLAIEGQRWRNLRAKLTPTFSSGKLKIMLPAIIEVAGKFRECLMENLSKNPEVEMRDLLGRFTTDVIGTCAFGLDCNSLKDPDNEFRQMGNKAFDSSPNNGFKRQFMRSFRSLSRILGFKSFHEDVSVFFMKVVKDTVQYREENNIQRNDFMDLLIKIKNNGNFDDTLTVEEIAAQALLFFLAGFETSSTTLTYCLYELALHQDIQKKARSEIKRVLGNHEGKISYESVLEMKYLDQIINESLRKYPPAGTLPRVVTQTYKVPKTDIIFEKNLKILIPVYGIHHDPEYYPDPEVFDPERFNDVEIQKRHPLAFIPFGEGPRNCIGLRFGMMQIRVGLIELLTNFKFTKSSKTVVPLQFSNKNVILTPVGGMWLTVKTIN